MSARETGLRPFVEVEVLRTPLPWQAYVLPVSGFPMPRLESDLLVGFLGRLSDAATKRWGLSSEVSCSSNNSAVKNAGRYLPTTASDGCLMLDWGSGPTVKHPVYGRKRNWMHIRLAPRLRALIFQVFRINAAGAARNQARDEMFCYGPVMEVLTGENPDDFVSKAKAVYLDFIKDRSYRCYPYYVPLIEGKTIENAKLEQLERWCTGVTVYIRQSFEDKGIVIAGSVPLDALFKELGGKLERQGTAWRMPL